MDEFVISKPKHCPYCDGKHSWWSDTGALHICLSCRRRTRNDYVPLYTAIYPVRFNLDLENDIYEGLRII